MQSPAMDHVEFTVNGVKYAVGSEVSSSMMLVDYLRETLELRGTKYMCREGGCGACIVAASTSSGAPLLAVNACMVSITSCHGWDITTIENLGNRKKGYHILQKTLAEHNGSQCGYCSPAWVMNMYSFLQRGTKPSKLEVERAFGGNICRCTGYRPILEAFKRFAKDERNVLDIEDLNICRKTGVSCKKTCKDDDDWCFLNADGLDDSIKIRLKDDRNWYKVNNLDQVFKILDKIKNECYMLVGGNTAKGVYPIPEYTNELIDISTVRELKICEVDQNLIVGAGMTISELSDTFKNVMANQDGFAYLQKLIDHIRLIAHFPVRNIGTVAGNLMIKHTHKEFPSDLYLLFETVGAYVALLNSQKTYQKMSMEQFLRENMKGRLIVHILLPPLSAKHKIVTFKIMPRSQNAHAIVNAGFLFELTEGNVVQRARIVFGGLSNTFTRAKLTEQFLMGKQLFKNEVLQAALQVLENEMIVEDIPPEPSVKYRKSLALSLFYKGLLSICPSNILIEKYFTGATKIHEVRPVSTAKQIFDTNPTLWPLNQPIPKVEALIQCAGETKYTDDLPSHADEVYAAFILSTISVGTLLKIDASYALKQQGVLAVYTASDIPGINSFTPAGATFYTSNEEVFCSGQVRYFNQPIGIVVAETQHMAELAAKMVKVTYKNVQKPVLDIKEAVKDPNRRTLNTSKTATDKGKDIVKVIKGENTIYGQYHFTMENISCVTRPTEEGIEIFVTSQWIDGVQMMVSKALNIPENRIDVYVRRLGGAFGFKISRSIQIAVACSLVAVKMNKSCRFVLPLTSAMRAMGKRLPCHTKFECSVNSSGVIQYVNYELNEDNGYKINEMLTMLGTDVYYNCYNNSRWDYVCYDVVTDTAKNTWCRSPGSLESIAMAEYLLERISYELSLDPFDVRLANLDTTRYGDLRQMAEDLKKSASYTERRARVTSFNAKNMWSKKGLRVSFLRWTPVGASIFDVNLSIFHGDGTIIITHGGVEMGQGINTKAVQICAYFFKVPIDKIQIKANSTIIAPNSFITGGSLGSQNVGLGVKRCCEAMLARLDPIRKGMNNPTWEQLITQAYNSNVDLQVHSYVGTTDVFNFDILGIAVAEVEVDVLTGETEVVRVDMLQDAGQSVSPEIDLGQIEGAYVMGQGYWTSESLVYDPKTGELLTDRSWFYKVPLATDIPQDFRVTFKKKSYSFDDILGAKGTGEPPMCLSIVIGFAIREAIAAARQDAGIPVTEWFDIEGPYTVEKIKLAASAKKKDFKFN